MNDKQKKIVALGLGGLIILGGGVAIGSHLYPKTIETIKTVEVTKEVPVEKIVTVEKNVTITKEVPVDNGNLANVMSFVKDNFDEDISVEYIVFETDAKIDAESYIRENFKGLLKDNDYFDDGATLGDYRTSEVTLTKISDAEVTNRDYDNKDATLDYQLKIKAKKDGSDSETFYFNVSIPFEKGKLVSDDVEIVLE